MKALKVIGVVVAVVGIVATAGALLAPATALSAGGFLGVSAATLASIGAIAGVAGAVIGIGTALFAPKPSFSTAGNPLNFQTNPQSGLPYPIGRTRMSGVRIHADTYDAPAYKSESKQDVLAFAVLLGAGGPMEEVQAFRGDKETVTFNAGTGAAIGTYADWMAQKVSLGLAGASALALSFGGVAFPGWTSAHKLTGIAHALWDLRHDAKGEHFGAGVPEPEWIGKWARAYDPRLDSTYPGGSGAHRALNEATYAWTANPALIALTWCLGRWQNGKRTLGIGAPVANIRVADFVEAANVADANDWSCGGVEWSTDSKWSVLKRMLQAGGAEPTMTGAMIGCRVNCPRVSIATVTGDKLLVSLSLATTRSRRDRFNTVIPRYRSEDHDWEVVSGTPVAVPAYVTEDGGARTKEVDFPLVQHESGGTGNAQAGQLAAYEIVNSREAGPIRFTTGPEYVGVKTGDVITLDVPDEGLDAQPVLIRSRSIDPASFKITFEAETETDAKHAFALGKTTTPPPTWEPEPPDLTPPAPAAGLWALTTAATADGQPSITIAGTCEFPGADAVLLEYRKVGAANWETLGKGEASAPVRRTVAPLQSASQYEARVAYQSGNRVGPWLARGPVTTSTYSVTTFLANDNDRNALVPDTPGGLTTLIVARSFDSGNKSLQGTFSFTHNASPAHRNNIDGIEIGYWVADTAAAKTMGTDERENWRFIVTDLANSSHSVIFVEDGAANKFYTVGVRAVRAVAFDLSPTGFIKSAIKQFGPYQPAAVQDWTGSVDGTPASSIADAYGNFSTDNDGNGLVPGAPTGVACGSVQYADSTAQIDVTWSFSQSADPAAANNADGYLVGLRFSTSSAGYTYNPADDQFIRWHIVERPDLKRERFNGMPSDWYYTAIVRPFRRVRTDVDPDGLIVGAAGQSSAVTPHHPTTSPNFTGRIDSETASNIKNWAGYANTGLNSNGTIKSGKIDNPAALVAGIISDSDWEPQGATIALGTNDTFASSTFLEVDSRGTRLRVELLLDYEILVNNPTQDTEYSMTVEIWVERISNGADYFSSDAAPIGAGGVFSLSEKWIAANGSGNKGFGRGMAAFRHDFEGLPAGAFRIGYRLKTPAGNSATCRPYRYLRAEDIGGGQ